MTEQGSLFLGDARSSSARVDPSESQDSLGQYMTPLWIAEAIIERYFADLRAGDHVLEPSCGVGRFLDAFAAVRPDLRVAGVEIDPALASTARERHGARVLTGDFLGCDLRPLKIRPVAVVGNPPFTASVIDAFLERSHRILPQGGRVGFILPAYYFQIASKPDALSRRWSMLSEHIPRNVFPGLSLPLCFTVFSKDRRRTMIGFAFYGLAAAVDRFGARYRDMMVSGGTPGVSIWRSVVEQALRDLGGEADLSVLYARIEGQRPSPNPHWRAKVRQVVQLIATRTGKSTWRVNA
jgi:SAM-dependent methyltransferase